MEEAKPAQKDFLTGFYTRDHLMSTMTKRIIESNLHKEKFSILLVDIDHFKGINDKYGHLWGDEYLKYVSSTLRLTLEDKGMIFRYGGDEFVVIFLTPDPKQAFALAKQFNIVLRNRPFLYNGRLFKISLSCGLATYPNNGKKAEDLLEQADKALYFSKRYGRNTTTAVSKIGLQRLKMFVIVFTEIIFIFALVFSLNSLFRGAPLKAISRHLPIKGLGASGPKADTTIVLKSGDVIMGHIVFENQNKIVVQVSLGQGTCTMDIEKALIQSTKKE